MELTTIRGMLVPTAWALVGTHVLLQIALVMSQISTGRFVVVDGLAWLSALLALVVGLAAGWAGAERRPRPVAIAAVVVTVTGLAVLAGTGGASVAVTLGAATSPWEVVAQSLILVSALVVQVLALLALIRVLPLTAGAVAAAAPAQPVAIEAEPPAGRAPVWQADRAAGAAWHTAGAAAAGAAAVDWGRPGERSGWAASGRPAVTTGESGPGSTSAALDSGGPRAAGAADPDVTRVVPGARDGAEHPPSAASGSGIDFGPRAIARRYADDEEQDLTRRAPPGGRRQPPRWTPLEDPTQPPPQA